MNTPHASPSHRIHRLLPVGMWLGLGLMAVTAIATQSPDATLVLTDCHIRSPGYPVSVAAQCGHLEVPENRHANDGRKIQLNIARIPATGANPKKDPVLFLAGGPGQSAVESFPAMHGAWRHILRERDVILVDQRGTGQSNPLNCDFDLPSPILDTTLDDNAQITAALQACLENLSANPRHYTTRNAIEDLEDVRRALGIEQWNLLGVSYGTRKALTYLKYHPDAIRAVILDGVVPQDQALGKDIDKNLTEALQKQFAKCADQPACHAAFGDSTATLWKLLDKYQEQPASIRLPDPLSGEYTDFELTRDNLALAVRLFAYTPNTMALIPLLLHRAANGQPENLAAQAITIEKSLKDNIANGLELSIICAEDAPFYPAESNPPGVLGTRQIDTIRHACATWPHASVPASFKEPVHSNKPVLLLSGELDPITPPAFAERAARTLGQSQHIIVKGQGHNVFPRGCLPRLVARFFDQPNETIEDTCLDDFDTPAFFVDLMGPEE